MVVGELVEARKGASVFTVVSLDVIMHQKLPVSASTRDSLRPVRKITNQTYSPFALNIQESTTDFSLNNILHPILSGIAMRMAY